ncbi:unnamed protein product [Arctogadus glacialis]
MDACVSALSIVAHALHPSHSVDSLTRLLSVRLAEGPLQGAPLLQSLEPSSAKEIKRCPGLARGIGAALAILLCGGGEVLE